MNPEKEKAPAGARTVEPNHDHSIPESQEFLDARQWLGREVFLSYGWEMTTWDNTPEYIREDHAKKAWRALVAVHGEQSARLVLAKKYDAVKGGAK